MALGVYNIYMKDCILWDKAINPNGYGAKWYRGRTIGAHRYTWIINKGKIPSGMLVCHSCDNPTCVNIDHLFLGSQLDNMRDKIRKGRLKVGNPLKTKDGLRQCFECGNIFPETDFHKNGISKYTGKVLRKHVCKNCRTFTSRFV
jgi:hypothetical protein